MVHTHALTRTHTHTHNPRTRIHTHTHTHTHIHPHIIRRNSGTLLCVCFHLISVFRMYIRTNEHTCRQFIYLYRVNVDQFESCLNSADLFLSSIVNTYKGRHMFIYTRTHVYTCTYTYIYIYMYMCIFIYIYLCIYIYTRTYIGSRVIRKSNSNQ